MSDDADKFRDRLVEAADHVISCCLLDDGFTLDRAVREGLTGSEFPVHGEIFVELRKMKKAGIPIAIDVLLPRLDHPDDRSEIIRLTGPSSPQTTAHVGHYLKLLKKQGWIDERISEARDQIEMLEAGYIEPPDDTRVQPRPITAFAYPSDDDPNMLLGSEDYLGRGGGLLFVSHAGAGKSSWAMDACMMWALGRAWMGIRSHQPRKTLIIQAEDSDRYIGKIFTSFAHVNQLSADDLKLLAANCVIVRLKGVSGSAFFAQLKSLTEEHQPDLVVINPIYLYAEGDITRSEFAQPFLLGLDAVNKAEKWAYILIHHTGKPQAKGSNGKRAEVEDWESAYMGFGSSYLANWPRASILLEPVAGQPGKFQIKLGKGGFNAGVTKAVDQGAGIRHEPVTRIAIRHSKAKMPVNGRDRPVFYWEVDDEPEAPESKSTGRPPKYTFQEFGFLMPKPGEPFLPANQIHRKVSQVSGVSPSAFRDLMVRAWKEGQIERQELPNGQVVYGFSGKAEVVNGGNGGKLVESQ